VVGVLGVVVLGVVGRVRVLGMVVLGVAGRVAVVVVAVVLVIVVMPLDAREFGGRDRDGRLVHRREHRLDEAVVAAAVVDDEVGAVDREPVARGDLVGVRILRNRRDDARDLGVVAGDGRGDVA